MMVLKRTLILILAALPAFAGSERPFNTGDVVVTSMAVSSGACGPHAFGSGFGADLYRRGSVAPSPLGGNLLNPGNNFLNPTPTEPVTYSPALNRMILGTYTRPTLDAYGHIIGTSTTLETLDAAGRVAPLLTLPQYSRVTALSGVGREILAVVVQSGPYTRELWRIAAADGTATEQIALPLPPPGLPIYDVTSIDLGADRCTLAYAVPGEVVHRYDICARRPLEDVATQPAAAVHFLPGGELLVSEKIGPSLANFSQLARYDRGGRLISTVYPAVMSSQSITSIAIDPDGFTAWIVATHSLSGCLQSGSLMAVNVSSGALTAGPWASFGVRVAVAGQWRAAEQPVRGRAVR